MIASTDPIADMLSRIRNGLAAGKDTVSLPHSKTNEAVAKVLVSNGFIVQAKTSGDKVKKQLEITLRREDQNSPISHLKRLSRPGHRVYSPAAKIPAVRRGRGLVIVSTSKGVMSGVDAKTKKLGGELICEVY